MIKIDIMQTRRHIHERNWSDIPEDCCLSFAAKVRLLRKTLFDKNSLETIASSRGYELRVAFIKRPMLNHSIVEVTFRHEPTFVPAAYETLDHYQVTAIPAVDLKPGVLEELAMGMIEK